jgi:hypothetical protein
LAAVVENDTEILILIGVAALAIFKVGPFSRLIQVALLAATQMVDPKIWNPGDYIPAVLYWAAHFLTLKLWQIASAEVGGAGTTDLFIRSIGFGDRRVMFGERRTDTSAQTMLGPGESMLDLTIYGQLCCAQETSRRWLSCRR